MTSSVPVCQSLASEPRSSILQGLQQELGASQAQTAAAEGAAEQARVEAAEARREAERRADAFAPGTPEVRLPTSMLGGAPPRPAWIFCKPSKVIMASLETRNMAEPSRICWLPFLHLANLRTWPDSSARRSQPKSDAIDEAEHVALEEAAGRLVEEKRRLEGQCKELAMMVERQEKGRQKLLAEVRQDVSEQGDTLLALGWGHGLPNHCFVEGRGGATVCSPGVAALVIGVLLIGRLIRSAPCRSIRSRLR